VRYSPFADARILAQKPKYFKQRKLTSVQTPEISCFIGLFYHIKRTSATVPADSWADTIDIDIRPSFFYTY